MLLRNFQKFIIEISIHDDRDRGRPPKPTPIQFRGKDTLALSLWQRAEELRSKRGLSYLNGYSAKSFYVAKSRLVCVSNSR